MPTKKLFTVFCVVIFVTLSACAPSETDAPADTEAPPQVASEPASGSWAGDTFYSAAHMGISADDERPESFEWEVKRAMANLGTTLREVGLDYTDVVKSNVYLADGSKFQAMNGIYKTFFPENPPCRTTVFVAGLPFDAQFSITVIATRNQDRKYIYPEGVEPSPQAVFSPGILAGDTLYLSGQGSRNYLTREFPEGDIDAHVRQSVENLGAVLKAAGLDYSNVTRAEVYLTDMGQYDAMNKAYTEFFPAAPPARTTVAVAGLPGEAPVEITFLATTEASAREVVHPESVEMRPMYSTALRVRDQLFLSGKGGWGEGDAPAQARQVMDFLSDVLEAGGLDFSNVVEGKIYLTDMSTFEAVETAYSSFFTGQVPPRTYVGVEGLPGDGARVEITLLAHGSE